MTTNTTEKMCFLSVLAIHLIKVDVESTFEPIIGNELQSKINLMPYNIRYKLQNTLTKVVNKESNNVTTIVI